MTDAHDELITAALWRAAREAAEVPLTAEEDGEAFVAFIVAEVGRDLAGRGVYLEPARVRRALHALTGYGGPA